MGGRLGVVQKAILERLQDRGDWVNLQALTVYVYHPDRFIWEGKHFWSEDPGRPGWSYTRTEYTATRRAVKRLMKRNLVQTRRLSGCGDDGPTTPVTQVRLSPDANTKPK